MHNASHVTIHKRGFLSSFAFGLFGLLTAVVVCGTGVAVYALRVADRKVDQVLGFSGSLLGNLDELKESLPPALSDALNDRRDPSYRQHLGAEVRMAADKRTPDLTHLVVEVTNNGPDVVTMLPLRIVLLDEGEVPVRSFVTYAATPLTIDGDWRGPLLPGAKRLCSISVRPLDDGLTPIVEITDVRLWSAPNSTVAAAATLGTQVE